MSYVCAHILSICTRMLFVCQSYVLVCHLYVIRMCSYVICMSLVCHPYVTHMYSYVIRMSLVCTRFSSVCHSYVLVCHPSVTCMYSYVIRMSLACGFTMNLYLIIVYTFIYKYFFNKFLFCVCQMQPASGVLQSICPEQFTDAFTRMCSLKRCSWNFSKTHRKTPWSESLLIKL